MIKIGKALSKRPVIQAEVQAMKEKRKLKVSLPLCTLITFRWTCTWFYLIPLSCQFAGAEFELTAQNAYIGAAVGLVFG